MKNRRNLTWALAALLLILLWDFADRAVYYSPLSSSDVLATSPPGKDGESKTGEQQTESKSSWSTAIVDKNLFSKSRALGAGGLPPSSDGSKEDGTGPGAQDAGVVRPNVTLSGIITNQFGEHVAFLLFDNDSPIGVRKGETIKGVRVVQIDDRRVLLEWKSSEFELTLSVSPLIKR